LSRERAADGVDAVLGASVMHGHVASESRVVFGGEELRHEVVKGEAAMLENSRLAVLREDGVVGMEGTGTAHGDALFTRRDHVKADATLSLGVEHDEIHDGDTDHIRVQFDDFLVADLWLQTGINHTTFLIQNPECRHGIVFCRSRKIEGGREAGIDRAGEVYSINRSDMLLPLRTGISE